MPKPDVRIEELIDRFSADDACPARLLCDDHPADTVAFTVVESDLTARDLTYGELRRAIRSAGGVPRRAWRRSGRRRRHVDGQVRRTRRVGPGYLAARGGARAAVHRIRTRGDRHGGLEGSDARMLIVDADQRSKLDPSDDMPADAPWRVVTVGDDRRDGDLSFDELIAGPASAVEPAVTGPAAPFIMIFHLGDNRSAEGCPVPVRGLAHMVMYLEYGYDLREQDVYWKYRQIQGGLTACTTQSSARLPCRGAPQHPAAARVFGGTLVAGARLNSVSPTSRLHPLSNERCVTREAPAGVPTALCVERRRTTHAGPAPLG